MIVDLFAGPGGWDVGLRDHLGVDDVLGVEVDADACATREAAGLRTLRADVSALDPADVGPADGLLASPPCQAWSMAGKRAATVDRERCHRHALSCADGWVAYDPADYADARTPLVHEPLRWAWALGPRWVALEQVPPVLDYWRTVAHVLRGWGYAVWCDVLNAADYGVPQTRRRAILMARRDGRVSPPEPTHARHPDPGGMFGGEQLPWVTMAQALGCGRRVGDWQFVAAGETGEGRPRDPDESPAATLSGKGTAYWVHERPAKSTPTSASGCRRSPADAGGTQGDTLDGSDRVTVEQAAVLQGFPADYPWQGSKTSRFAQVGNAIPPPLAAAICRRATSSAMVDGDA